ncbi:MAG: class I SAM-dependent methyltransferase [Acidobacteria bacterium]|nr:class I SAM-dependent methyltransferase [Acidobacteriota bacterium]
MAKRRRTDYSLIADSYDRRYLLNRLPGIAAALHRLLDRLRPAAVLEVGCGTGRWLTECAGRAPRVIGVDPFTEMLRRAADKGETFHLVCGRDTPLPLRDHSIDLVYCVNAIHHFSSPHGFVIEAARILRPGGTLAVVGMDPRRGAAQWYPYRFFEGTFARDLDRFPAWEEMNRWADAAGLVPAPRQEAERSYARFAGAEVGQDPFLEKEACSQLTMLTEAEYAAGRRRIDTAVRAAEAAGRSLVLETEIIFDLWSAVKPAESRPVIGGGRTSSG